MVGKLVIKLFGGKPYKGIITSYDHSHRWYHVVYEDEDEEDLTWRQLFVSEWRKLDRRQILWLDEKHKRIVLGHVSRYEWLF